MQARVEIVIVTHRPPEAMLERAVRSVVDAEVPPGSAVRVTVVDNGGRADASLGSVDLESAPGVAILSEPNRGFGASANVGIAAASDRGADVVIVLNDDVDVAPTWLAPLLAEFDDDGVGAVQPLLVSADGVVVDSAGVHIDRFGAGSDLGRGRSVSDLGDEPVDLAVFTGGAIAFRCEFLDDVGRFDERFFLYYEDVELARRGLRRGWRYRLAPASQVRHSGSATTSTMGDEIVLLRERNRLWSAAMNGSTREVVSAIWLSVRRLRHRPRGTHARGLAAGLAGMPIRFLARLTTHHPA